MTSEYRHQRKVQGVGVDGDFPFLLFGAMPGGASGTYILPAPEKVRELLVGSLGSAIGVLIALIGVTGWTAAIMPQDLAVAGGNFPRLCVYYRPAIVPHAICHRVWCMIRCIAIYTQTECRCKPYYCPRDDKAITPARVEVDDKARVEVDDEGLHAR